MSAARLCMSVLLALMATGLPRVSCAQGGPPMITDDPGTPGPGEWEINIAATGVHHGSSSEVESPLLDINYGIGERIQLKYEVPWVAQRENGRTRSGLGNSLLGVKWRFYDAGERGWQISTYPQVELRNPRSRSAERGLSEEGTGVLLPFELQRKLPAIGINFEAGRELRSRGNDSWFGGVVFGHEMTERVEVMAELHGESADASNESAVAVSIGGRVAVGGIGTLLVSLGRELHNALDERSFFGYVGWQFTSSK